jgi:4-alpha-glucanotransferase
MKLTIRLRYATRFGQALFLCGDHECLGGSQPERALPLRFLNAEFWELTLDFPDNGLPKDPLSYFFILRDPDGSVLEDFGRDRGLDLAALGGSHIVVLDSWNGLGTVENVFFTEPFRNVLLHPKREFPAVPSSAALTHWFHVKAPLLPEGQTVCLLGAAASLGAWNSSKPILLQRDSANGRFRASLDLSGTPLPVDYKYGIYDLNKNALIRFENGGNRTLATNAPEGGKVVVNDGFARWPSPPWRGAGVAVPVFSLRSERSFGIGEFLDLPLLADWARRAGLKLIQILPVNDTSATHTWQDSYPYASISAFALHPLYLNLDRLAGAGAQPLPQSLAAERQRLNALPTLDYEAVMRAKLAFLRQIFPARGAAILASKEYQIFRAQNKHWLEPYAAFCFLRDKFGTADFNRWPEHRLYSAERIQRLAAQDATAREEMAFHCFLQFHLHLQLQEAANSLHAQGLILKGDLAIGVSPRSADVWQQPELFHTDTQAGAPPDPFAAKGQNWGFPTYNWPRMKEDGYAWWKHRFAQMSHYFDAFRIDHILGFFRIWSIPRHAVEGILGYFVPALPVRKAEFAPRGIAFEYERFTKPFINDAVLTEIFGDRAESVKEQFLQTASPDSYWLLPQFSTQGAVEEYFASPQNKSLDPRLKEGLFDLISNVLLIEPPDGNGETFHFRLGMEQTPSFRHLDAPTQARLQELSVDYFYRRQEDFWRREALQKLPALKRVTNMLICGEDLGMVPDCVAPVMKQLGLLSLEIQRMPKALNQNFSRPADAPYLSVVTPSTHDMSTIRGWWMEDGAQTQLFFNQELQHPGPAPVACEPWISQEIIRQHLASPALWSIFQLQDLLGLDENLRCPDIDSERINIPAIPRHYWRYRVHLSLEALAQAESFTQQLENLVQQSGR